MATTYLDTVTTYRVAYSCRHGSRDVQATPNAWRAGGMVAAQKETCPRCSAATAARRTVLATAAPGEKLLTARYAGRCRVCAQAVSAGTEVMWLADAGVRHLTCTAVAETGCAMCGAEGPLMTSSVRGAVCADCYDRVESRS